MREYTIVNILYTRKSPVRMSELIAEVGLSERTLRDVIRALDKTGEANGFGIRMIRGQGYLLEIGDEAKFSSYQEKGMLQLDQVDLDNKQSRQQYLLFYLLQNDNYQSMDNMAEEIGVSRSTIISDLKEVEQRLAAFRLSLKRRAHYGMKIEGKSKTSVKPFLTLSCNRVIRCSIRRIFMLLVRTLMLSSLRDFYCKSSRKKN